MAIVLALLLASLCVIKKVSLSPGATVLDRFTILINRDKKTSGSRKSMPSVEAEVSFRKRWSLLVFLFSHCTVAAVCRTRGDPRRNQC